MQFRTKLALAFNIFVVTWDAFAGARAVLHHHPFLGGLDWGGAILVGGLTYRMYRAAQRHNRVIDELARLHQAHHDQLQNLQAHYRAIENEEEMATPEEFELAMQNLSKACQATGARFVVESNYCSLEFTHNNGHRFKFSVGTNQLWCTEWDTDNVPCVNDQTCYFLHTGTQPQPPWPETVATALLLLRRDPYLFHFWRDHHGTPRVTSVASQAESSPHLGPVGTIGPI